MRTQELELVTVIIPMVGECTLLPCGNELPEGLRTYRKSLQLAKVVYLTELGDISHRQVQEIFKAVAWKLSESGLISGADIGIIISGEHDAYASIDTDTEGQTPEKCVTVMDFCYCHKQPKDGPLSVFANHFEILLDELPVTEAFDTGDRNICFCLFQGVYRPFE